MRILHYSLGLHPFRSGGLAKYSTDLMEKQIELGYDIYFLYPGKIGIINRKNKIVETKEGKNIKVFELINPLPIPILQGINNIDKFIKKGDIENYKSFLYKVKPDIIHMHTLMGIHKEFLEVANSMNIKVVYTTHDYFGICPKAVLYDGKQICKHKGIGEHCTSCNKSALPYWKLIALQSHMYKKLKNNKVVSILRKTDYNKINTQVTEAVETSSGSIDYILLKEFYQSLFAKIDFFHFNSKLTEKIFRSYLNDIHGRTINILHSDVSDHRVIRQFHQNKLRIAYLTSCTNFKGFNILKQAIDELHNEKFDIQLNVHNDYQSDTSYIKGYGMYDNNDLPEIYNKMDLLVVPSLCYETFGFLVLEGLSYGMPVLISKNVGAKDIVKDGITGIVIEPTLDALKKGIVVCYENRELLSKMNENILKENIDFCFEKHVEQINGIYKECMSM